VVSVSDGDTLRVLDAGQRVTIRQACIDAPEMAQAPYLVPGSIRSPELSGEGGVSSFIGPNTTPTTNSQAVSAVPRNGCQSYTSPSQPIPTRRAESSLSSSTSAKRSNLSSLWRPRRWSGGLVPMRHCPDQFEGRPPGKRATEVWWCSGLFEAVGHLGGALL
jgi:hypothetical protein